MSRGKSKPRKGKGASRRETQTTQTMASTEDEKAPPRDDADAYADEGEGEVVDAEVIDAAVVRPVVVEPAVVRPQIVDAEVVKPIVIRPRSADEITVVVADPLAAGSAEAFLANSERTPPPLIVDDGMADYLAEFEDAPTVPDTTPRWARVSGQ